MASYRLDGFKFDRANLKGIDADCIKGINAYLCSRETEINTIQTVEVLCDGGPFDGRHIELTAGECSASFCVGQWIGHYSHGGTWEGTTGQAVAPIEAADTMRTSSKRGAKECDLGKGFSALRQLLAEMAEDPADRAFSRDKVRSASIKHGFTDDMGARIEYPAARGMYCVFNDPMVSFARTRRGRTIENQTPRYKITYQQSFDHGNAWAMDDFGDLFSVPDTFSARSDDEHAEFVILERFARYTIGRASYTIRATSEAVDALRQRILKSKKWFADKHLAAARPAQSADDDARDQAQLDAINANIDDKARQDVAQVVAAATMAAAIERASTAQQDAPAAAGSRELEMVDCGSDAVATVCELGGAAGHTGSIGRVSAGVSDAPQSQGGQSVPGTSFDQFKTNMGGVLGDFPEAPQEEPGGASSGKFETKSPEASAPVVAVKSITRAWVPELGQHVKAKSGAWEAWTYVHKSGKHCFVMYRGQSAKSWRHFNFKDRARMLKSLVYYAAEAQAIADGIAKRAADNRARLAKGHDLAAGDVVRSSWGYDQTNVDHYQIIKVIGKRTVEVRKLAEHIEATGDMTGRCTPIPGDFVGDVMRRQVDRMGQVNILSASYGRAHKIEPLAVVAGVRCYPATSWSSYA